MNSSNLLLIVAIEVAVLLLVVAIFLIIQNRSLRLLVKQLKDKAKDLLQELKQERSKKEPETVDVPELKETSYLDHIEAEIEKTLSHHASLNSNQDISLDIEPGTPLPHRAAALRHAMLLAEKEAFSLSNEDAPDWRGLRARYDRMFSFCEDFPDESDTESNDDTSEALDALRNELENARKRVNNLEKFKQLYFELEDKWGISQKAAANHFENLNNMASELDSTGEMQQVLDDYHTSYHDVDRIINQGADGQTIIDTSSPGRTSSAEVRQLRAVAADQHRIIEGLQRQLKDATTDEERNNVVSGLQNELNKQLRFAQESETCIQLLEDELNVAGKDLEQLKAKLGQLPELKTELIGLRKENDALDLKYNKVVTENRKLQKLAQESASSASADIGENTKLRKELNDMEARYNELEEKFLDLKLQQ